jgi:hypothetical protein
MLKALIEGPFAFKAGVRSTAISSRQDRFVTELACLTGRVQSKVSRTLDRKPHPIGK